MPRLPGTVMAFHPPSASFNSQNCLGLDYKPCDYSTLGKKELPLQSKACGQPGERLPVSGFSPRKPFVTTKLRHILISICLTLLSSANYIPNRGRALLTEALLLETFRKLTENPESCMAVPPRQEERSSHTDTKRPGFPQQGPTSSQSYIK